MTVLISLDVPEEAGATNLSWIMRGFFGSICECYKQNQYADQKLSSCVCLS